MATVSIFDLNKRELLVTPETIVVVPGGAHALRIRSNCAWCITSRPELATVDRICGFGDGAVTVSSPIDANIDGEITFATDDESVIQKVMISSTEPEPDTNVESLTEEENISNNPS